MREQQLEPWDYTKFAEKLGKKVSWAYRLEDPNESIPTIPTLLAVARSFDVALDVRFIPFSSLIHDTANLTPASFEVSSFREEFPTEATALESLSKEDQCRIQKWLEGPVPIKIHSAQAALNGTEGLGSDQRQPPMRAGVGSQLSCGAEMRYGNR